MNGLPARFQGIQGSLAPRTYTYPTFLKKIVSFVKKQEEKSPYYRLYYVFQHGDRRDFLDVTGKIDRVLDVLNAVGHGKRIPFEELFETVTVYGTGRNAIMDKVDPLLADGYTNIAADEGGNLRRRNQLVQQEQHERWNTFQESKMADKLPLNVLEHQIAPFMFGARGVPKVNGVKTRRRKSRRRGRTLRRRG